MGNNTEEFYKELYKKITSTNFKERLDFINKNLDEVKCHKNYVLHEKPRKSYCVQSHYKKFDVEAYKKAKEKKPFRKEEWICKSAMGETFDGLGTIVDYQVPLKTTNKDIGNGKIDLISTDGKAAYLLEVKVGRSTEYPLRAIMEIYTYWHLVGGENPEYFIDHSKIKGAKELKKAIVLFENDKHFIYQKLIDNKKELFKLMKDLGVECFIAYTGNDENKITSFKKLDLCI